MALLSKISIKWKLSAALIATGLTLILIYVVIATRVFESDKISYVFDSQASKLDSLKSVIESKFEHEILTARSVIATYDSVQGKPSAAGEQIFREEPTLLAIELWSTDRKTTVLRLQKAGASMPPAEEKANAIPFGQIDLRVLESGHFMLLMSFNHADEGVLLLRAEIDPAEFLPTPSPTQSLALAQGNKILRISDLRGIKKELFEKIASESNGSNRTRFFNFDKARFLVSETPIKMGQLRLVTLTPESEALGALGTLFNRSVIFVLLSTFGLIAVSVTLARALTKTLQILTRSAEAIGSGNFDATPSVQSQDEMGVLATAFAKMSTEIKRLLVETREKARMEAELKTASLLQERLMPNHATSEFGDIEVSGVVRSSSECGGDWWYYFKQGDDLIVAIADATGHGTPAALITASARSSFALFERENHSLKDMIHKWDFVVASCSQQRVFMTGVLLKINTLTGEGSFINAAHESPMVMRAGLGNDYSLDFFDSNAAKRIGDGASSNAVETKFSLGPNDSVILYTDGLFAITNPAGKVLSERRFGKLLASKSETCRSAKDFTDMTLRSFDQHRQNLPLPDDVTVVSVRRKGSSFDLSAG